MRRWKGVPRGKPSKEVDCAKIKAAAFDVDHSGDVFTVRVTEQLADVIMTSPVSPAAGRS